MKATPSFPDGRQFDSGCAFGIETAVVDHLASVGGPVSLSCLSGLSRWLPLRLEASSFGVVSDIYRIWLSKSRFTLLNLVRRPHQTPK